MSYWRIEPAPPRMRFSPVEIREILIAVGALTLAFALSFAGGVGGLGPFLDRPDGGFEFAVILLASLVAVVTGFLLHELAHKAVAQRYGCIAEFRYYPMGLALGLLTAAFAFIFAAPGAVMIAGTVGPKEHVRISAAGPGTNLMIGAVFLALAVPASPLQGVLRIIAFVNVFLGFFNLIPFPPLDGSKIFAFNKAVWAAMIACVAVLYAVVVYVVPGL